MNPVKKGIRLWPLIIVLSLSILSIVYVWIRDAAHRQDKVILTHLLLIIAAILGILWLLGLSRLTWKTKFKSFALIFISVIAFIFLFQFDGFSGDLVPKFGLRWGESVISPISVSHIQDKSDEPKSDFPQFLGPNRNAVITDITLNTNWEENPPELLWRIPVGAAWSGFAVVGTSAITQEQQDEWEKVVCYDLYTGKEKWTHRDKARYYTSLGGLGPRATPAIDGNQVFTVGSTGILNCLDFESGRQIWSTNIFEENNAKAPPWGVSCSPLIVEDLVIVSAGGAVAYQKNSGNIAWTGHRIKSAYSSPVLLTLADTEQVVLFDHGLITSHEPTTGQLLWKQTWSSQVECAAQPTSLPDNKLLVSTAYGIGAKLFQISKGNQSEKFIVDLLWETIRFKAKFTTIIHYKDYIYGLDDGIFTCIDPSDGSRQWKKGRYGHGQTLLIGDVLLVLTESGEIVLLKPDPEKHTELARIQGINGQTWNNPAITGNLLLVRNSQEAACYRLQTQ